MKKIRAVAALLFILIGGKSAIFGLGSIFAGEKTIWTGILLVIGLVIVLAAIDFWRGNERARKVLIISTWLWFVFSVIQVSAVGLWAASSVGFNNLASVVQALAIPLLILGIPTAMALWLLKKSVPCGNR
jgi:hypothetical protein